MSGISKKLRDKIRRQAKNRCGYCLLPQNLNPTLLEIEHLQPTAAGGTEDEENLWLACRECNSHKSLKTHGFDEKTRRIRLFKSAQAELKQAFRLQRGQNRNYRQNRLRQSNSRNLET